MRPTLVDGGGQQNRIVYRRLRPTDTDAVMDLAIQGMRPDLYPGHLDRAKVRASVEHFGASQTDWHQVAFDGEQPVGLAAVAVHEHPWFERCQAIVVAFYAVRPVVYRRLMRSVFDWYSAQPMLRRLIWPLERDAGEKTQRFARRHGMNKFNQVACHEKE